MHLKSLTLKGFKSFAERTTLDFGPGVSVVVGPNGSGKSNITDAVMWAMGEQSPLAVRGQSMQDVIFGGARGVAPRSFAEVEIVLDNSDGAVELPLGEISIVRRLERSGEGEYRLCGARCRLADVMEVLSDTGLGKETHSVISQGRVEAIVTSKPRERRLLIEEAAGLGKHRSRRRRAQLKLERTQENLDRALDVEREARSRLRPLKRQAEAAQLHERLERQSLDARLELTAAEVAGRLAELTGAEERARQAREARDEVELRLQEVSDRRGQAERALSERAERHDALAALLYRARAAHERLALRGEQNHERAGALARRIGAAELELESLQAALGQDRLQDDGGDRVGMLESQLAELEREREREIEREISGMHAERAQLAAQLGELDAAVSGAGDALAGADARLDTAREALREAEREGAEAARTVARVGAELAAVSQFMRSHAHPSRRASRGGEQREVVALDERLRVGAGYELALAAVLGGRLEAALVADVPGAARLLDGSGPDGGTALLAGDEAARALVEGDSGEKAAAQGSLAAGLELAAPCPGAQSMLQLVSVPAALAPLAVKLLAEVWVVPRLEDVPKDFHGIAVTRSGRAWFASSGEVRQVAQGGAERVLAARNERDRLVAASESAAQGQHACEQRIQQALAALGECETERERAQTELRELQRRRDDAAEQERRAAWLIEQRRLEPAQGALAVKRAQVEGELAAERRQAERSRREREERVQRLAALRSRGELDRALLPLAERLAGALQELVGQAAARAEQLELELASDRREGERMAGELRECAAQEAEIQAQLRAEGEAVTMAEVAAQRLRDQLQEAQAELEAIVARLDLSAQELERRRAEPVSDERSQELQSRLQRLERRREQLGPVNPLAREEYEEALEHVEELEARRGDLEAALRELRAIIKEADRQIHDTFQATFTAAADNFQELVADVFPGGEGRLRLVDERIAPRTVIGGQPAERTPEAHELDAEAQEMAAEVEEGDGAQPGAEHLSREELLGVEIEITPAGKSTKRLSLLSGGEKSMTALAFLFAVFLARPCPFYILDEVEAALDDLNLDRFLALLRRYAGRAQFIVITHQKRTMEAADWLYGVSMGGDGVSKVISRRLPAEAQDSFGEPHVSEAA